MRSQVEVGDAAGRCADVGVRHLIGRESYEELMIPVYRPAALVPVRGSGSRVWDERGRDYVDFAAGIAVASLGHANPALNSVLRDQASKVWHLSNAVANKPMLRLAALLKEISFAERVFFTNSGAEANEAALKLARRRGHKRFGSWKHKIIAFDNGFHGRSLFTVSVGGKKEYREHFGPLPGGIEHVAFNDLNALEAVMDESVCAVIMEPVQGEGGVVPATPRFAQGVRRLCRKYDALLIYDEVQTGNGRTGTVFAYEQLNVTPDIVTTAKGLGGGFPIGAVLTTAELAAALPPGSHGTTCGGNPLGCAVAEAVLRKVTSADVLRNVAARSEELRMQLRRLSREYGLFGEPRGMGLLMGVPATGAWEGKTRDLMAKFLEEGVWVLTAGPSVLRFTPALNISEKTLAEGVRRIERVLGGW